MRFHLLLASFFALSSTGVLSMPLLAQRIDSVDLAAREPAPPAKPAAKSPVPASGPSCMKANDCTAHCAGKTKGAVICDHSNTGKIDKPGFCRCGDKTIEGMSNKLFGVVAEGMKKFGDSPMAKALEGLLKGLKTAAEVTTMVLGKVLPGHLKTPFLKLVDEVATVFGPKSFLDDVPTVRKVADAIKWV